MFRLAFIDLDGTLLNPDGAVSPRTKRALAALAERGVQVILASGRAPRMVRRFQLDLGLSGPAVCYNGALVSASPEGGILWECRLSPDTALAVLAILHRAKIGNILCEADDRLAGEVQDAVLAQAQREEWGLETDLPLPGFLKDGAHKFIAIGDRVHDAAWRREFTEALRDRVALVASAPGADWLEIMPSGASKAKAAQGLCAMLGFDLTQAAAFGDAENDVALLASVGLGIAMGNGDPRAKAAARLVAPANTEDGLAQVVEELLAAG
jgi:Cof subfamily protein (haloacid dehalogenase superfamily)